MTENNSIIIDAPKRLFNQNPSLSKQGKLQLSPILLGGGVFGFDYNDEDTLTSKIPEQTIRTALQHGVTAIDTSPYYSVSEQVLGTVFRSIKNDFPRESYLIITKAGRYSKGDQGFDYDPDRIRKSVKQSLQLMDTTYLDALYMHDVEFVADQVGGANEQGCKVGPDGRIRDEDLVKWGLAEGDEAKIIGPGDQKVLDAMAVLFELKSQGIVKCVGFSGYPLPTLLRLARLVKAKLGPIDMMQSYCHHTLQNTTLSTYLPLFHAAGVKQVISASPLSMGLLRTARGPSWHPASEELQRATIEAAQLATAKGTTLEQLALGFGLTSCCAREGEGEGEARVVPVVVGCSTPEEVGQTMRVWESIGPAGYREPGTGNGEHVELEKQVVEVFKKAGVYNWTWQVGSSN
ncbi:Aldo/keto reductase [Meredithblackwellia eburnea MCA 4105]